jgi:hypothetical protein
MRFLVMMPSTGKHVVPVVETVPLCGNARLEIDRVTDPAITSSTRLPSIAAPARTALALLAHARQIRRGHRQR